MVPRPQRRAMLALVVALIAPVAFAQLADVAPGGGSTAGEAALQHASLQADQELSILDFIQKGGLMMIPIGLSSLVLLAVGSERLISLRRQRIIPQRFVAELTAVMEESNNDGSKALEYCRAKQSPIADICAAGIRKLGRPVEVIERAVQDAGEWEVFKLRKNVRTLSVIAAVAPLMGLVGTIFGMIRAFQTVAVSGEALGKTELLAEGIYEAMVTTAAGLLVAIPAVILYHWISARIDKLVAEMDRICIAFIEDSLVSEPVTAPPFARAADRPVESAEANNTAKAVL